METSKNGEWCIEGEKVYTDKKTRCSECGRRLVPRESASGLFWTLPPHKKKGYKIKRKKGHNVKKEKIKKHTQPNMLS
jgi:hypothetical protein